MDLRPEFQNLNNPNDLLSLKKIISEMADELDTLYSTSAPNGSISARQGRICLYKNGSNYEKWINTDGGTVWIKIGGSTNALWEIDGTETQLATADEIDMQSKKIINVTDCTADQDAATKKYVDDNETALDYKVKADAGDGTPGYLDGKVDGVTTGITAGNKLEVIDGAIDDDKHATGLITNMGAWASAVEGSATQVSVDSLIVGYCTAGGGGSSDIDFDVKVDASASPSTIRTQIDNLNSGAAGSIDCFSVFVPAGEYYHITETVGEVTAFILPLD